MMNKQEDTRIRELDFFTYNKVTYMCKARVGEMVIYNNEMVHESACERVTEPFKFSLNNMRSGVQMISKERMEQLGKHNFNPKGDDEYYKGELKQAALFALQLYDDNSMSLYPKGWDDWFAVKCYTKSEIQLLTVAGALLAAEIDRIKRLEDSNE